MRWHHSACTSIHTCPRFFSIAKVCHATILQGELGINFQPGVTLMDAYSLADVAQPNLRTPVIAILPPPSIYDAAVSSQLALSLE